jgi:hypothetical protein
MPRKNLRTSRARITARRYGAPPKHRIHSMVASMTTLPWTNSMWTELNRTGAIERPTTYWDHMRRMYQSELLARAMGLPMGALLIR